MKTNMGSLRLHWKNLRTSDRVRKNTWLNWSGPTPRMTTGPWPSGTALALACFLSACAAGERDRIEESTVIVPADFGQPDSVTMISKNELVAFTGSLASLSYSMLNVDEHRQVWQRQWSTDRVFAPLGSFLTRDRSILVAGLSIGPTFSMVGLFVDPTLQPVVPAGAAPPPWPEIAVARIDLQGELRGSVAYSERFLASCATLAGDSIVVGGRALGGAGTTPSGGGFALLKMGPDLKKDWFRVIPRDPTSIYMGIASLGERTLIAGTSSDDKGSLSPFVACVDANGETIWEYLKPEPNGSAGLTAVSSNPSQRNWCAVGSIRSFDSTELYDGFVIRGDAEGNIDWKIRISNRAGSLSHIAYVPGDHWVVAGHRGKCLCCDAIIRRRLIVLGDDGFVEQELTLEEDSIAGVRSLAPFREDQSVFAYGTTEQGRAWYDIIEW
jgi:hypothetical protein